MDLAGNLSPASELGRQAYLDRKLEEVAQLLLCAPTPALGLFHCRENLLLDGPLHSGGQ